jgi:hypothetical protein
MSVHVFGFMVRKPTLTIEEFHAYWAFEHTSADPDVPAEERGPGAREAFRGYVQNQHAEALDPPTAARASAFDGFAELWLDASDVWRAVTASSAFAYARRDEQNFLARAPEFVVTSDHVVRAPARSAEVAKVALLFARRPGVTVEEFRAAWAGPHVAALADAVPGLRGHVRCETTDDSYSFCEPRYDGVEELWVDGDVRTAVSSAGLGLESVADHVASVAVRERIVVPTPY